MTNVLNVSKLIIHFCKTDSLFKLQWEFWANLTKISSGFSGRLNIAEMQKNIIGCLVLVLLKLMKLK